MGRRGPKPKPTNLKVLGGNPGKRRLNKKEPRPKTGVPVCPPHLSLEAKREWKRLIGVLRPLGLVTRLDRANFAAYCQAWGRWVEAEKKLLENGPVIETPNGSLQFSPFLNMANRAMKQIKEFGALFGLSPADRVGLEVEPPPGPGSPTDAGAAFLFGPRQ